MNRQAFLQQFAPSRLSVTAGLEAYTRPLDERRAYHLLRRATFGTSLQDVRKLVGMKAEDAVRLLLDNALSRPAPTPPDWVNQAFQNPERLPVGQRQKAYDDIFKKVYEQNYALKYWWIEQMQRDTFSLREKLTLFWHGHFTTKFSIDAIMPAPLMYRQNQLFRTSHQGNFRALVEAVTLDGAMLIFLNGQDNGKAKPNENYSRELLELYTTGVGHYTEKDVQEGARALTGWRTNYFSDEWTFMPPFTTFFLPSEHDVGPKTYLGVSMPSTENNSENFVRENVVRRLIGIIHEQRAEAVARFICEKLYRFFVYSHPAETDAAVIDGMARTFRSSGFQIRPVVEQLLSSAHFFDEANLGVQIKTPSEFIVGLTRHFNVKYDWQEWVMLQMGQELLNPPTVAGWPGHRTWLTTRTFPFAVQQASYFVFEQKDAVLINWAKQFPDYTDVRKFVQAVGTMMLARPFSQKRLDRYVGILLAGAPDYEWTNILNDPVPAGYRLKLFLIALVKAPDFHLN